MRKRVYSTRPQMMVLALYTLAASFAFPAFPMFVLSASEKGNQTYSEHYQHATCFKYCVSILSSRLIDPFFSFLPIYCSNMQTCSILGKLSDTNGRKSVLLFSLSCTAIEFFILGTLLSQEMIFISRMFSGIGDGMVSVLYASVADSIYLNDDFVAKEFGKMGAIIAIGALLGPLLGSVLVLKGGGSLCFLAGSFTIGVAIFLVFFIMEETVPAVQKYTRRLEKKDDNDIEYQEEVLMSALPLKPIEKRINYSSKNYDIISFIIVIWVMNGSFWSISESKTNLNS